mmetsp:Transcript_30414/g.35419  ORF Transcript_30414/g.35419 Transcript_30414/m.35419 type:complete len:130 (+) Transcript_30414:72-461(+)
MLDQASPFYYSENVDKEENRFKEILQKFSFLDNSDSDSSSNVSSHNKQLRRQNKRRPIKLHNSFVFHSKLKQMHIRSKAQAATIKAQINYCAFTSSSEYDTVNFDTDSISIILDTGASRIRSPIAFKIL